MFSKNILGLDYKEKIKRIEGLAQTLNVWLAKEDDAATEVRRIKMEMFELYEDLRPLLTEKTVQTQ